MQFFSAEQEVTTDADTIAAPVLTKTKNSITAAMVVDENALALFYGLEIVTAQGVVTRRAVGGTDQAPAPGEVSVTINGLTPGTTYRCRAYQSDAPMAAI